jgi:perosamine synthetase
VGKARAFGVDRSFAERSIPGMYDVPTLGLNYRMSDINAAIGRIQVKRLPEILARRKANFERLKKAVSALGSLRVLDTWHADAVNSHYCLSLVLEGKLGARRDAVVLNMKAKGVGTSVYYPQPVPRLAYYRNKYGYDPKTFPRAEEVSDRSIALPVGPHLGAEDMDYVARVLGDAIKEESK